VGYLSSPTVRIGLVARGARFNESPDTEYISSGVCQKDVSAVALGRHGNFFLWGFGASPAGMTEEGKKVFVNAVAYMAQFDGRTPIARKYNDRMATTDDVRDIVEGATKEMYELYVASAQRFNEANAATKKRLEAKKAAGETLTKDEETQLQYAGYNQSIYSWEVFLKQHMGTWADRFGTDDVAFRKYMEENMGYVYCEPNAFFTWTLDEDAQEIGVSNHDIRLLDVCIEMLEKEDRPELAQRVLQRYTGENFSAASEWKNCLEHNR